MERREFLSSIAAMGLTANFKIKKENQFESKEKLKKIIETADVPSEAGHIFSGKLLKRLADEYIPNTILGTIGFNNGAMVRLSEASHMINRLRFVDNKLLADIILLNTDHGKRLATLNKTENVKFYLAGMCESQKIGIYVPEDYKIITIFAGISPNLA